jgi:hypothetical protein
MWVDENDGPTIRCGICFDEGYFLDETLAQQRVDKLNEEYSKSKHPYGTDDLEQHFEVVMLEKNNT